MPAILLLLFFCFFFFCFSFVSLLLSNLFWIFKIIKLSSRNLYLKTMKLFSNFWQQNLFSYFLEKNFRCKFCLDELSSLEDTRFFFFFFDRMITFLHLLSLWYSFIIHIITLKKCRGKKRQKKHEKPDDEVDSILAIKLKLILWIFVSLE